MLTAIVPVKRLDLAKGRLAGLLSQPERGALVLAMLDDVLMALGAARAVDRVAVVSDEPLALARATRAGADPLIDSSTSLNGALVQAARHYAARGASAALIVHADVPLVTAGEIDRFVATLEQQRGIAIAGARDGGTNALLVRPPLALPFLFGPGSRDRHLTAARERGLPAYSFRGYGLALDVDRPDDLLTLAELDGETATQRLARELSVCERVMCV